MSVWVGVYVCMCVYVCGGRGDRDGEAEYYSLKKRGKF